MKSRLVALIMAVVLAMSCGVAFATDTVSSASVADFYGDFALTGDDLMNAVNSFSGFYCVSTINPDGTPNAAYFIFSMVKHDDQYYLQLGLAENQSKQNLLANGKGVAMYAATPSTEADAKPFAVSGARILFQNVEDQAVLEALKANANETAMFFEITDVRSLG